jgi:ribosomal protein S6E (S10)
MIVTFKYIIKLGENEKTLVNGVSNFTPKKKKKKKSLKKSLISHKIRIFFVVINYNYFKAGKTMHD